MIIKPFSYPLLSVPFATGMAVLGSGELVPVLNAGDLIAAAFASQQSLIPQAAMITEPVTAAKILVVDDSATSPALWKRIFWNSMVL